MGKLIVLWDGAPYHRAKAVWSAAASLDIHLLPLPGYSPDLMAVEPLRRWLREDVACHHCHATAEDLIRYGMKTYPPSLRDKFNEIADQLCISSITLANCNTAPRNPAAAP